MEKLTREEELMIFKTINCGIIDKTVSHTNFMGGNDKRSALYNQGIQKGKLKGIVERFGKDVKNWRPVQSEKPCSLHQDKEGEDVCCE